MWHDYPASSRIRPAGRAVMPRGASGNRQPGRARALPSVGTGAAPGRSAVFYEANVFGQALTCRPRP
ncbi:hypothetical protein SXCC_00982 [Gluconacetobacter sp. SXCC-1]|nr:hypothetical protein SXCC_00982 [Gluconacetobacter sp. SXCC-1]